MEEKFNQENKGFRSWIYLWIFASSFVVFFVFYNFFFTEKYNFLVEESCDHTTSVCFHRSCEDEECPPNELEDYSQYYVQASEYSNCKKSEDCNLDDLCSSGMAQCEKIECISGIDQCTNQEI